MRVGVQVSRFFQNQQRKAKRWKRRLFHNNVSPWSLSLLCFIASSCRTTPLVKDMRALGRFLICCGFHWCFSHRRMLSPQGNRDWDSFMGCPRSTVAKGAQSHESYEGECPWKRTVTTVLWVHRKLAQSSVRQVVSKQWELSEQNKLEPYLATVVWAPLTRILVKISVVLVRSENGSTKTLFSLILGGFSIQVIVLV